MQSLIGGTFVPSGCGNGFSSMPLSMPLSRNRLLKRCNIDFDINALDGQPFWRMSGFAACC